MKFCPKCGKKNETGNLCDKCIRKEIKIEEIKLIICNCGSFLSNGEWKKSRNLESIIRKAVKLSTKRKILNVKPIISNIKLDTGIKKKIPVSFDFNGHEHLIYIDIEVIECSLCKHRKTQYFEGVFQLRNPNLEVERFINSKVKKSEKFGVWINKELKVKNGIDYYYVNKHFFSKLAYDTQAKFGGEVKISNKLFSRDRLTSKNIYRTNILIRIPKFKIKEIILVDNKLIKVSKIGKSLSGVKLLGNKSTELPIFL